MRLSQFGEKFRGSSGILELMDDLDLALNQPRAPGAPELLMLGGGNPGRIPELERRFRAEMEQLLNDGDRFERLLGVYDRPVGAGDFAAAMAKLLRDHCGWEIDARNVALTNGSQSAFFMLFNLFGGRRADGSRGRIVLPIVPEYIGYADTGIDPELFLSVRPRIDILEASDARRAGVFKYQVDLDALRATLDDLPSGEDAAALCISRPSNPSGNVVPDDDLRRLADLAAARDIPLIVDAAYGGPFPDIVFGDAQPLWRPGMIVTLSLSKFGLPGLRTGIVVADEEVIECLGRMNAVLNLAGGSAGPAIALELVRSGELIRLSRDVVRPYYQRKSDAATARFRELFRDLPGVRLHRSEGAFFLWLWFEGLPISTMELYRRLKARGTLVVPGHYYYPGHAGEDWPHVHECIRLSYAQADDIVERGLLSVQGEVRRAYGFD